MTSFVVSLQMVPVAYISLQMVSADETHAFNGSHCVVRTINGASGKQHATDGGSGVDL